MPEREYEVFRTLKGTQAYRITARSKADAVRGVIHEGRGEAISFEITDAAATAIAYPIDDLPAGTRTETPDEEHQQR